MTLTEFVTRAVSVPFVDRGRDYDGWDCWGCVRAALRDVWGIDLPSHDTGYETAGETPQDREAIRTLVMAGRAQWRRVDVPEPGDVPLLICIGRPVHVGLMVDGQRFLHTERRIGTVIERLSAPIWARRCEGVYRYDSAAAQPSITPTFAARLSSLES